MTDTKTGLAIVEWEPTFEADDKGGPWKPGKKFRTGPLNYIRFPTVGTFARRWSMIDRTAGEDAMRVKGIFDEMVRLVAGMNRPGREKGIIRAVDGTPATAAEIAEMLGQPVDAITKAIQVLLDRRIGLLQEVTDSQSEAPDTPDIPGDSPEIPGNIRCLADNSGTDTGAGSGARQGQGQRQEQDKGQEHPPGSPPEESACSALSLSDSLLSALRAAYGENQTIMNFWKWFRQRYQNTGENKIRGASEMVRRLIEKSKAADGEPAAFFIGAVKKSPEDGGFGYQPAKAHR
jgi:hypothetical protein